MTNFRRKPLPVKMPPYASGETDPAAIQQAKLQVSRVNAEQMGSAYSSEATLPFRTRLDYSVFAIAAMEAVSGRSNTPPQQTPEA